MDYVDINALMAKCNATWHATKVPTRHFNRIEKAWRQLARANIQINQHAMMVKALKSLRMPEISMPQSKSGKPGQQCCKRTRN
jgi:hypothetical protein